MLKQMPDKDDDYIPGVTPYVKPTEAELGFKPLSNTEFEKVKEHAAETREERLGGPGGLGLHETEAQFDRQLAVEHDELKHFENDTSDQNFDPDYNYPQPYPDAMFEKKFTFKQINDFMKWVLGLNHTKEQEKENK